MPDPTASGRKPRPGDVLVGRFDALAPDGDAIGQIACESGDYTIRERGGALFSLVRFTVLRRRKSRLDVRTLELVEPSVDAVVARCAHHGVCGGCSLQDLAYPAQLRVKLELAKGVLAAHGHHSAPSSVVGCDSPWSYRNKMDFSFGPRRWLEPARWQQATAAAGEDGVAALGLHPRGYHSKVLEIGECSIAFPGAAAIVASARAIARELGLDAYDTRVHRGWLRHLVLRHSAAEGSILAVLVTLDESPQRARNFFDLLLTRHPQITTAVQLVNSKPATVATGERTILWRGDGKLRERLAGSWFEIEWSTFFQTNTPAAERLIERIVERAALSPNDVVHDLYCGVGAITLALARRARRALGFELVEAAVESARRAAAANGIGNTEFFAGDVLATWSDQQRALAGDVLVVDPPRAGVHPKLLSALADSSARRIVLVACRLESGARDAAVLAARGWQLASVDAFDLFPHTPHLECVLTLERP